MEKVVEYIKNKDILFRDGDEEKSLENIVEAIKEYGYDAVDRCIEEIRKHCEISRAWGMIASPRRMLEILDNIKNEIV